MTRPTPPVITTPPPRPTQGGEAGRDALNRATDLIVLVRDQGPCATGAYLDRLTPDQHYALTITLAAMVPDDHPISDLLGWVSQIGLTLERDANAARRRNRRRTAASTTDTNRSAA